MVKVTYATLGIMVVESKDVLTIVKALDVVAWGRVVATPNINML